MIELNVGNKWSASFLSKIIDLNQASERCRVTSLYGDPLQHAAGCLERGVRPSERLPSIGEDELPEYLHIANMAGITINYTLNKSCVGAIDIAAAIATAEHLASSIDNVMLTGASVLLIHELNELGIPLELSTIPNQCSVNFISGIIERYQNIKKVCLPIYMNRDFRKIEHLVKSFPNVKFELIANELCLSSTNTCIYRADCYNSQSHGITTKCFQLCSQHRRDVTISWLMAPFILPQWMGLYQTTTGINNFKLTGRTLPESVLMRNVMRYMCENAEGDITTLWGSGLPGQELPPSGIEMKRLDDYIRGFINGLSFPCEKMLCGRECRYCHDWYRSYRAGAGL